MNVYAVPLRCLYHADFPNLLFAGRNIGTRREAFVSTRVMNTCGLSGQAAAALAWGCLRWGKSPAALAPEEVERIRQTLLREDMFLPGLSNQDPEDLALPRRAPRPLSGAGRRARHAAGGLALLPPAQDVYKRQLYLSRMNCR